jgi:hypothetical protein
MNDGLIATWVDTAQLDLPTENQKQSTRRVTLLKEQMPPLQRPDAARVEQGRQIGIRQVSKDGAPFQGGPIIWRQQRA